MTKHSINKSWTSKNLLQELMAQVLTNKGLLMGKMKWIKHNNTLTLSLPYFNLNTDMNTTSFQSNLNHWVKIILSFIKVYYYHGINKDIKVVQLQLRNVQYPTMNADILAQYLSLVSELKSRQDIKSIIMDSLPLTLGNEQIMHLSSLNLLNTNLLGNKNTNTTELPSYIKGIKLITEGRTQFISMSSRRLRYSFLSGKLDTNINKIPNTKHSIMSNEGYFTVKVFINNT